MYYSYYTTIYQVYGLGSSLRSRAYAEIVGLLMGFLF